MEEGLGQGFSSEGRGRERARAYSDQRVGTWRKGWNGRERKEREIECCGRLNKQEHEVF